MNEQILSIVRQVLLFGGGILVTKGWIDSTTLATVVGAIITLVGSGWALWTRRANGLVASAAALPNVAAIKTDAATATAVPSTKVQAA